MIPDWRRWHADESSFEFMWRHFVIESELRGMSDVEWDCLWGVATADYMVRG